MNAMQRSYNAVFLLPVYLQSHHFCLTEHTNALYPGSIHGAYLSGKRAVHKMVCHRFATALLCVGVVLARGMPGCATGVCLADSGITVEWGCAPFTVSTEGLKGPPPFH